MHIWVDSRVLYVYVHQKLNLGFGLIICGGAVEQTPRRIRCTNRVIAPYASFNSAAILSLISLLEAVAGAARYVLFASESFFVLLVNGT
jgi:hypothetical protein